MKHMTGLGYTEHKERHMETDKEEESTELEAEHRGQEKTHK